MAEEKLLSLDDKAYCTFVGHLLADAVKERTESVQRLRMEYGDEEDYSLNFEAVFCEGDKKKRAASSVKTAKALLKKMSPELGETEIAISESVADIKGGTILRYGDIETNCSVEAVISAARGTMEPRVAEILFSHSKTAE